MHGYARLARQMMNDHGLHDWKIAWNRAKRTHGSCNYDTRTLTFSAVAFGVIGDDEARETILHEIAHALAGRGTEHGPEWIAVYRRIGGTGGQYVSKQANAAVNQFAPWVGTCSKGHKVHYHRAPLRVKGCGKCSPGRWTPEATLSFRKDGRKVPVGSMPVRYVREVIMLRKQYGARFPI